MIRDRLSQDLKAAAKAGEPVRTATLRLILAAIKDRDIAARTEDNTDGVPETDVLAILAKMIRQREESATIYDEAGRIELAERERAEIEIIREYMPKPLGQKDVDAAIRSAIDESGASSIRDMGRIMSVLKARYPGRMDFGKVGQQVRAALAN